LYANPWMVKNLLEIDLERGFVLILTTLFLYMLCKNIWRTRISLFASYSHFLVYISHTIFTTTMKKRFYQPNFLLLKNKVWLLNMLMLTWWKTKHEQSFFSYEAVFFVAIFYWKFWSLSLFVYVPIMLVVS